MDEFTKMMFLLCIGTFILTLLINKVKPNEGLMLNILSLLVCIFAIGTGLTDTELMQNTNSQGDIVVLFEAIIGFMHIPKLYQYCGVDH